MTTVLRLPRRMLVAFAALLCIAAIAPAAASATGYGSGGYGYTELAPNGDTVNALVGLGVTPSPAPGNTPADSFRFPITNSFFSALFSKQIRHSGGINLTAGEKVVTLRNFNINNGWKPNVSGQVLLNGTFPFGTGPVKLLDLDYAGARISISRGYLRVGPVTGRLSKEAAGALSLDAVFGAPDLTGVELGKLTINRKL